MPFPTYDRETLLRFAVATMHNRMGVDVTPGTFWYRLAESWTEVLVSPSGYQAYIANQILPTKADSATLDRHARLRGIEKKESRRAEGSVDIILKEE